MAACPAAGMSVWYDVACGPPARITTAPKPASEGLVPLYWYEGTALWVTVNPAAVSAVPRAAVPTELSSSMRSTFLMQVQTPPLQTPEPQTMPQPPQFAASVRTLFSQPFMAMPSQLAKPALHEASVHVEATQLATPLGGFVQGLVQLPQWLTSVGRYVSQPVESMVPQWA